MRRPMLLLALAVALFSAPARAQGVTVEVGKTTRVDVGFAKGLNCDDLSVAQVDIETSSAKTNQVVITGLKPGRTLCRVGLPSTGPTLLIHIIVVERND